jgi:hypothetical protein
MLLLTLCRTQQVKLVRTKRSREQAALTTELLSERALWLERIEGGEDALAKLGTKRLKKIDRLLLEIASDSEEDSD